MVKLLLIVLLARIGLYAFKKMLNAWGNLQALRYEQKHPGSLPRSGAGIVFNKKTGKPEETPGSVILPFD